MKQDATKPAAANVLQQQARFDTFIDHYNHERPHQALDMQVPADVYAPSSRPYRGLRGLDYPFHDWTITVTHCGRICFKGRKVNLSQVFAGQNVGVTQVSERIWLVTFMDTIWATSTMRRAGSNRSRIRSARKCYPCLRNELSPMCPEWTMKVGRARVDSNHRPPVPKPVRYQAELRPDKSVKDHSTPSWRIERIWSPGASSSTRRQHHYRPVVVILSIPG